MKKLFTLATCLMASVTCIAQLNVYHDGGTEVTNLTAKTIYANPGDTTTSTLTKIAIEGKVNNSRYTTAIGVSGYASSSSNNSSITRNSIGVQGKATNASGMNFGVYGIVPPPSSGYSNNGAGIYGSNKSTYTNVSGRYAGFFDGNVRILGNLTLTGTVNGVVISRGANESKSSAVTDESSLDATNNLAGLRLSSFYFEKPEVERTTFDSSEQINEKSVSSTVNTEIQDNGELQVLSKKHYSLNADQLEVVFPDLVYVNEDGTKSINYVEMVPILVQAINELQSQVNELKGGQEGAVKKTTGLSDTESVQWLSLAQNKPNPFSTQTDIEVSVPTTVQTAFLYVYDLQGKKVQQVDITGRGKQTVKVDAADLAEGMYLYSLIADGKVMETRRMIVEK